MQRNPKSTSLLNLQIPELSRSEALSLLQSRQIALAMILYNGNGSIFWLTENDPKQAVNVDRLLVLHSECRSMIEAGVDWIWGDLLVNKLAPYGTIGYVLDENQELETSFYEKLGSKSSSIFASRMGSVRSDKKAAPAIQNGTQGRETDKYLSVFLL